MPFSDTTVKDGLIQTVEFWTGKGDAGVSGDATLLKVVTARINAGFDRLMPLLMSYCDKYRWDDPAHSDQPFETVNLTSGTATYEDLEDDNNLDILNMIAVQILPSSTATVYETLERMTMDDERVPNAMAGSESGKPTHWLEFGNSLFLYPNPDYTVTAGIRKFFEREQSYFASTDTTKEPGIPRPFHELLALYAALDLLLRDNPQNQMLITRIEANIARRERQLKDLISARAPVKNIMRPKGTLYL